MHVLSLADLNDVYAFAETRLAQVIPDETERIFASWAVPWRREALEHYTRLGWSFVIRDEKGLSGFFLAQPLLFFRGQTQTLWVEHIEADSAQTRETLIEIAVKVAREKNLQRVLFANGSSLSKELARWNPSPMNDDIAEVKTTKG